MITQQSHQHGWYICHSCHLFETLAWDHSITGSLKDRLQVASDLLGKYREFDDAGAHSTDISWLLHSEAQLVQDLASTPSHHTETWKESLEREEADYCEQLRRIRQGLQDDDPESEEHALSRATNRRESKDKGKAKATKPEVPRRRTQWARCKPINEEQLERFDIDEEYDRNILGPALYEEWRHFGKNFDLKMRKRVVSEAQPGYSVDEHGNEVDSVGKPRGYW